MITSHIYHLVLKRQMTKLNAYQQTYSCFIDILFLSISLGCLFFILLGTRPLFVPDEGRYAEIIREMVNSGNYITPYLNGIKYFEKPNLFYWLGSLAVYLNGLNLWSIRGVNALLALLGCLFTYWIASKCYDRATGLCAALILGTSSLYFVMAHMISLDLTVTFFITTCLYTFLLGYQELSADKRNNYLFIAAACSALAVLTKGLIGIIFPLMVIGLSLTFIRKWRAIKQLPLLSCIAIFLLITIPWHALVQWYNPEFFHFYFIEQHILRYITTTVGHYQPVWYFIPILIIGFFPWVVFLPQTITTCLSSWRMQHHSTEIFFLVWATSIFLFFSFSKSKLIPYILPLFPPLAILVARYLVHHHTHRRGIKIGYIFLIFFSIAIACLFYWYTKHITLPYPTMAALYLNIAGALLVIGSVVSYLWIQHSQVTLSFITILVTMWLFLLILLAATPAIDTRTIQPLAFTLKPLLQAHDEVITYNQYFQDLPFYLKQRVSILNWQNELSFGMRYQHTKQWMINDADFWQRWNSNQRIFVVMSLDEYAHFKQKHPIIQAYFIDKTIANILISNKKRSYNA